jgi:hypothetical protein
LQPGNRDVEVDRAWSGAVEADKAVLAADEGDSVNGYCIGATRAAEQKESDEQGAEDFDGCLHVLS